MEHTDVKSNITQRIYLHGPLASQKHRFYRAFRGCPHLQRQSWGKDNDGTVNIILISSLLNRKQNTLINWTQVFLISRIKVETLVILNNQQRHSRCLWKTAFWLADPPPVPPSFHPFSHSIWFCALRVFSPLPSFLLMYTHHSTSSKYFAKLTAAVLENELLRVFLTSL